MRRIKHGSYMLSTGRRVHDVAGDAIGINEGLEVTYGHDADLLGVTPPDWLRQEHPDVCWTPAECVELADFMIARWQRFKQQHEGG